jgi:hypothetical protein
MPLTLIGIVALLVWGGNPPYPKATLNLACSDLAKGCTTRLSGREISVGMRGAVRPLQPFQIWAGAPGAHKVQAHFTMKGMDMGFNLYTLRQERDGLFRAQVTLPACVTGRRDWVMTLDIDHAMVNVPFSTE